MALITIILSLLLDHVLRYYRELRDHTWFQYYLTRLCSLIRIKIGTVQLLIVLLPPLVLVFAIQWLLTDFLYGSLYFVFAVAVLFYSLGPDNLSSEVDAYIHARHLGDDDEALHYAGALTNKKPSTVPDQQTSDVTRAILHIANERVFALLFWFVCLGPVGAVLYHLLTYIKGLDKDKEHKAMASKAALVQSILAWVPARLLAIGYALSGHFDGAIHAYKGRPQESNIAVSNQDVLVAAGLGALQDQQATDEISSVDAARHLVMRSVLIWVAVLAMLTLGGWLG